MKYTIKWWRDGQTPDGIGQKPDGIEYRSLSSDEIEPIICELKDTAHVRLIEIRNELGDLVAHYPDAKMHRPRTR